MAKDKEKENAGAEDAANVKAETQEKKAEAKKAASKKKPPFSVPANKAVTSKRGVLSNCEVKAEDFEGGQDTLDSLVKSGHVAKA